MTVFEHDGRLLVVDCGVLFPADDAPGVDLILPDFRRHRGPPRRHRRAGAHPRPRGPHRCRARSCCGSGPTSPSSGRGSRSRWSRPSARSTASRPHLLEVKEGTRLRHGELGLRVLRGQPLHPGRAGGRHPHPGGPGAAHRRHQARPAAPRRSAHRPRRVLPAGRRGGRPVPGRLHQRRRCPASSSPSARSARSSTTCSTGADARIIVACFASHVHRVQQVARRRGGARAAGLLRRPVDGAQHGTRRRDGLPHRARGPAGRARRRGDRSRTTASSTSPRARRASRSRRWRGWRAATTARCGSSQRTP